MEKINELWVRYKKWGESSVIGGLTVGAVKAVFMAAIFILVFYGFFMSRHKTLRSLPEGQLSVNPLRVTDKPSQDSFLNDSDNAANDNCSVMGINLHGILQTYIPFHSENDSSYNFDMVASEDIVRLIKQADEDPKIKAILIEVDSGGGSPVAGEEISYAIEHSDKPVVAVIRQTGASGAYWAISGADQIFASKNSDVGSIGVTSSYLSNTAKNLKDGYTFVQLSAGKYKDSGSPDKSLSSEERALFLRDINIIHSNFIEAVSQNRELPIEKVRSFSDGSTVLGESAKSLGLIDEIGGISEAEKYLENTIGEKPEICWQ